MYNAFTKRLMWFGMMLLRCLIAPWNALRYCRPPKRIPIIRNRLLTESATSLAAKIRTRQVTSEEVVQAYISRARDVNPVVNGMVEERFEAAIHEARLTDTLIQSGARSTQELEKDLPLLGVPISVKESIAVQGMSHTSAQWRRRECRAHEDAEVVRLVKEAGAIPFLVTTTPELCCNWETYSKIKGITRNPYDSRRTVGGSSGGEAAMLSSAASVIGLGSDVAGSARLPAFFTGVYGHKPTPGVVPNSGHYPSATDKDWSRYFSICPMVRYAEDLVPLLKVMAHENADRLRLDEKIEIKDVKVFYMEDDNGSETTNRMNPEITTAMRSAVAHLETKCKIKVQKVNLKNLKHGVEYAAMFLGKLDGVSNVFQKTDDNAEDRHNMFLEFVKYHLCISKSSYMSMLYGILKKTADSVSKEKFQRLLEETTSLHNEIKTLLGDNGVLMYPTFTDFAHRHYEIYFRFLNTMYMMVWNVLEMPVTQCPLGLGTNGLPMGIQLIAGPCNDRLTMALARELEAGFGGWIPPPHSDSPSLTK